MSIRPSCPIHEGYSFAIVGAGDRPRPTLHPAEENLLRSRKSPKRRLEFWLGRAAAKVALEKLGCEAQPVLQGPNNEPLWPEGMIGSIAHCGSCAAALVARRSITSAIGVDLERSGSVQETSVADVICCPSELRWATRDQDCSERLTMLFSAKEAAFKAFYPLCRRFIEFSDVVLSWNSESEIFRGRLLTSLSPELVSGYEFEIGCTRVGNLILSFVIQPATLERRSAGSVVIATGLAFS